MADIWQIDLLDINGTVIGHIERAGSADPLVKPTPSVALEFHYWAVDSTKMVWTQAIIVYKNSNEFARIDCQKRVIIRTNIQLPMAGPDWYYINLEVKDNELVPPTDRFMIDVIGIDGRTLGSTVVTQISDDLFEIPTFQYARSGQIAHLSLSKNSIVIAKLRELEYSAFGCIVTAGTYNSKHRMTVKDHEWLNAKKPAAKVCTCGGWAVYGRDAGIHSDTVAFQCDLLR